MTATLSLPPLFRPVAVAAEDGAGARARDLAAAGADPGTFVYAERFDVMDCAVVLDPGRPLREALPVLFCGALGLGDGLASVLPPGVEVDFAWPGDVRVNARRAGRIALAWPVDAHSGGIPDWLILEARLRIGAGEKRLVDEDDAPETSLAFENCPEITAQISAEAFARHFLTWIARFESDGFGPSRRQWAARAYRFEDTGAIRVGNQDGASVFDGIDAEGNLLLKDGAKQFSLIEALGLEQ